MLDCAPVQIRKRVLEAIRTNAAAAAALVGMVVCLTGLVRVCLCDPDPDVCGQPCHVCEDARPARKAAAVPEPACAAPRAVCEAGWTCPSHGALQAEGHGEGVCHHAPLALGDLFASSASVSAPAFCAAPPAWPALARRTAHPLRLRPVSTAPPDVGACCARSSFTRLYPRS